jgi:hypothetical protein
MAKQKELAGMERPVIQELEDKAEVYSKSMRKRVKAGVAEKADKAALIEAMKTHKLKSYKTGDGLIVTVAEGAPKIQLSDAADEGDDDEGEEPEAH